MDQEDQRPEIEPYSIQWLSAYFGRCVACDLRLRGCGVVGFKHNDFPGPICDACMMQVQPRLGMALFFINIGRELADDSPENSWDEDRHSAFLMASARLYHALESREWPVRPIGIVDFMERHGKDLGVIPLNAWVELLGGRQPVE